MTTRLIYLDTTIWNVLSEQAPEGERARQLCSKLDVHFTLGLNAYFEMLKSFFGKRSNALARGKQLFTCLRSYLESGVAVDCIRKKSRLPPSPSQLARNRRANSKSCLSTKIIGEEKQE